jgi:hypothetical protein
MNPKTTAMVEHLINQGAVQMHSIDNDGHIVYKITDKLKEVSPELYKDLKGQYDDHMFRLIEKGPTTMTWRLNG